MTGEERSGDAKNSVGVEVYPMPAFPTLIASSLEESTRFYVEGLGFHHIFTIHGPGSEPVLVHLRFARYADLLLEGAPAGFDRAQGRLGEGVKLTFSLALDGRVADELAGRAAALGSLVEGPIERPWNTRDVIVRDPDGYILVFTEPLDVGKSFDEVLGDATGSP
jgi:catechol 2,3-dioxygenase-like lactoylglutathione lyase family enzyme